MTVKFFTLIDDDGLIAPGTPLTPNLPTPRATLHLSDPRPTLPVMPTVGDLVVTPSGKWVLTAPTHCTNNHPLGGEQVLVGHLACLPCGGHTTWTCLQCDDVTYGPPAGEGCSMLNGPAEVRG